SVLRQHQVLRLSVSTPPACLKHRPPLTTHHSPLTTHRSPMTRWRITWAIILLAMVGLPLFMPVADLLADWQGWSAWSEGERLGSLLANTIKLVAFTLAVALPAGLAGAVLLYRTDLPLRRGLRL